MRKQLLTLLLGALPLCVMADVHGFQDEKGRWGFADEDGSTVIKPTYDEVTPFNGFGYAKVRKGQKWGFVDQKGNIALPVAYDEIGEFSGGLAAITKSKKHGFIDSTLVEVIPPKYFAMGSFNSEGRVWVNIGGKFAKNDASKVEGGKFGILDRTGREIVPPKYATIGTFKLFEWMPSDENFKKYSGVKQRCYRESPTDFIYTYRFLDTHDGAMTPLHEGRGYWMSTNSDHTKNGIADAEGNEILKPGKYKYAWWPTEGFAPVQIKSGKENFLNISTGQLLLKKDCYSAYAFQDGVAKILTQDRENDNVLIDITGEPITTNFTHIYGRSGGNYVVELNGKYGLLNSQGREILPPNCAAVLPQHEGMHMVQKGSSDPCGFIDAEGNYVIQPTYNWANSFINGYASVFVENSRTGFIDTTGKYVVEPVWKGSKILTTYKPRYMWVQDDDDLYYSLDTTTGQKAFSTGYKNVWNYDVHYEGLAIVAPKDGAYGVIDHDGNVLVPCEFSDTQAAQGAYAYLLDSGYDSWRPILTHRFKLRNDPNRNTYKLTQTVASTLWDY